MNEAPAPPHSDASRGGNVGRELAVFLCVLTAASLALYVSGWELWPRAMLAICVYTFVPGFAVLAFLPKLRPLARTGIAAALSLTLMAAYSYLLIVLKAFYPAIIIWTLLPVSCVALLIGAIRRNEPRSVTGLVADRAKSILNDLRGSVAARLALAAVITANVLWIAGASVVDWHKIDHLGLVPLLPPTWKVAYYGLLVAIAIYAVSKSPRPWLIGISVASLIALVYLSPLIIYEAPPYPWTYKHVGVTELLLQKHEAYTFVDIYNRWPAFFGQSGVFTRFGGFSNTVQYVGWAEFYFVSIQAMLIGSMARTEHRSHGYAGLAVAMFVLINWIGQAYFSPQATGFTLMLAVLYVVWSQLYAGGNVFGRIVAAVGGFFVRTKQRWPAAPETTEWSKSTACVVALVLVAGLTLVHQLTPYVLLMQLLLITFLGFMRPWWMLFAAAGVTVLYLLPQFTWINDNFGVFNSLDPTRNISREQVVEIACDASCEKVNNTVMFSTAAWALGAGIATLVIGRRRPETRLPLLVLCFFAPFLTLLGQSYGGEAVLRVVMFSAPFSGMLIALSVIVAKRANVRRVAAVVIILAMGYSFMYAFYGMAGDRYISKSSIRAGEYLYKNAPPRSLAIPTGPNLPGQLGANYWQVYSPYEGIYLCWDVFQNDYDPQVAAAVAAWSSLSTKDVFIISSPQQLRVATEAGFLKPGVGNQLLQGLVDSGRFKVWHTDGDTTIYRYVPGSGPGATENARDAARCTRPEQFGGSRAKTEKLLEEARAAGAFGQL